MRAYILTDLEGAALVFRWDQVLEDVPAKHEAMRQLTREVNSCIDGILATQPDAQIFVRDGHGFGGIRYEDLHERADLLPHANTQRPYCLDLGFDALFVVGQHSMAGTPNGLLAHTFAFEIEHYRLNGRPVGELGTYAYMAGTFFDTSTVFLSGDDKAVAEARALIPDIVTVEVKQGLGTEVGISRSGVEACRMIGEGAARAAEQVAEKKHAPLRMNVPYECEVRVYAGQEHWLERYLALPEVRRADGRTVIAESGDVQGVLW
jgi:D-amino peptidase